MRNQILMNRKQFKKPKFNEQKAAKEAKLRINRKLLEKPKLE